MNEYDESMGGFSLLKNRMLGRRITEPLLAKKQREVGDHDDYIDESVIDTLSENQQVNAKKIMRVSRLHGDHVVSWTADGNVSING